ncbi:hypothetical protein [Streptomyces antioxidans]|uniref:hypothetical protein n=1 Tax=Streptomyces antioxidans TaxID=1507734 RepID=UPI00142D52E1|nr:hypothetical protein [Streptomyces antioxidans]
MTRDTVATDTPAASATSLIVTRRRSFTYASPSLPLAGARPRSADPVGSSAEIVAHPVVAQPAAAERPALASCAHPRRTAAVPGA